jgi:hypothetical protein
MVRPGKGDFYEGVPLRYTNVQVARDGRMGDRLMLTDKNDFAPRLGIAWSPTPKWSVRAGAGIFYSQEIGNARFDDSNAGRARRQENNTASPPSRGHFLAAVRAWSTSPALYLGG